MYVIHNVMSDTQVTGIDFSPPAGVRYVQGDRQLVRHVSGQCPVHLHQSYREADTLKNCGVNVLRSMQEEGVDCKPRWESLDWSWVPEVDQASLNSRADVGQPKELSRI